MIIPSIDIMDGKVVKLRQGMHKVYETQELDKIIKKFRIFPQINVIDLDAAMDKGSNKELIKKLCKKITCNVGGGIRSIEIAKEYLSSGANSIIIGTNATKNFLKNFSKKK